MTMIVHLINCTPLIFLSICARNQIFHQFNDYQKVSNNNTHNMSQLSEHNVMNIKKLLQLFLM